MKRSKLVRDESGTTALEFALTAPVFFLFIFGVKLRPVGLTLVALLLIFSAAGAIAHWRGGAADCGCFPVAGESTFGEAFLIRNGFLILACLWVVFRFTGTTRKNHQSVPLQVS